MAKQQGTTLTGTYENIIFYKRNGEYLMRAKGNTGNQAEAARKQASLMGKSSAISGKIRTAFKPFSPGPVNRKMMYRLNNALQKWLRAGELNTDVILNDVAALRGFDLLQSDEGTGGLQIGMPVHRTGDHKLVMNIPAFDSPNPISPLPFNGQIKLHVIAVSCRVEDPTDSKSYETILEINYDGTPVAAQDLIIPLETRAGCITVVALSVNDATASIISAMYN